MSSKAKILALIGAKLTEEEKTQLEAALDEEGSDDGGSISLQKLQKSLNNLSGADDVSFESVEGLDAETLQKSLTAAATISEGVLDGQEKMIVVLDRNQAALLKSLTGMAQNQRLNIEVTQATGEAMEELFTHMNGMAKELAELRKSLGTPKTPKAVINQLQAVTPPQVTVVPSPYDKAPTENQDNLLVKSMAEFERIQNDPAQHERAVALSRAISQMEGGTPQRQFAHLFPAS